MTDGYGLPRNLEADGGVPPFGDPWHAQAFATALALAQAGMFSWAEWVEIFSREIQNNPQREDEESEAAYYRQWLAALEIILVRHSALSVEEIAEAAEHWRRSFLNTPHGAPVAFSREWQDAPGPPMPEGNEHHHHSRRDHPNSTPAGVSPAVALKKLAATPTTTTSSRTSH